MDLDKLISEVTNIVMERLNSECRVRARLLVLSEAESKDIEKVLDGIAALEYFNNIKQLDSCDAVICPSICASGLANIARGTASGVIQEAYLQAVLSNIRLYQLKDGVEYHRYNDTMPAALLSAYRDYEGDLRSYGVRFIALQDLRKEIQAITGKPEPVNDKRLGSGSSSIPASRKLITEKLIKELYDSGTKELFIGKRDIITSLAEDFIRSSHITIKRE